MNTLFIIEAKSTPLTQGKHHDAKSTQGRSRHKEAIPSIDICHTCGLALPFMRKSRDKKRKANHVWCSV